MIYEYLEIMKFLPSSPHWWIRTFTWNRYTGWGGVLHRGCV